MFVFSKFGARNFIFVLTWNEKPAPDSQRRFYGAGVYCLAGLEDWTCVCVMGFRASLADLDILCISVGVVDLFMFTIGYRAKYRNLIG